MQEIGTRPSAVPPRPFLRPLIARARLARLAKVVAPPDHFAALPKACFRLIYLDPAWKFVAGPGRAPRYKTMPFKQLLDLARQIPALAHPDGCRMVLWVTRPFLEKGLQFMRAAGFRYSTCRTWAKLWPAEDGLFVMPDSLARGTGYEVIDDSEIIIIAKRGRPERVPPGKQPRGVFYAQRTHVHSEKPELVRDELRRMFGGPRLELFARHEREGWTSWGNEVGKLDARPSIRSRGNPARVRRDAGKDEGRPRPRDRRQAELFGADGGACGEAARRPRRRRNQHQGT
jgi:N6-adenosine-specific RNA methylase IME4